MAQCPVKSCEICENSSGSRYCTDCEQFFCKSCEISHLKSKSCRSHVFKDADIANPEVRTSICKQHGEKFTYYCNTCTLLTCNICLPTTHNKHDFCLLDAAASKARSLLDKDVSAAEDSIKQAKQKISTSQLSLRKFEVEVENVKKDIVERVDAIVNVLNDTKDSYLKSIDEHRMKESQKLKQEILDIKKGTEKDQAILNKMKSSISVDNNLVSITRTETSTPGRIQFGLVSTKPEPEKLIGNLNFVNSSTIERDHSVKPSTTIKVGDRVRVKPSVEKPKHGWGNESHQSIGIVTSIQGQDLSLNFPENIGWKGTLTEMELV
ncbi:HERC2 [Mytilus edulis]|uniref:HERC2 n=1 Tax=Mytilus edulis TaxID=6550 RepID=A0A8S3US13_MYTED|nr:HERC2 [Mytilus edulis]